MDPFQPPDPVCKFCDDTCSGTCEGAREATNVAAIAGATADTFKQLADYFEEPSVIGAGCGVAPMPTEEDRKAAWKALYVAEFVKVGLDAETAASWFDELDWDEVKDQAPEDLAADEMEYWTDDGDGPVD